MVPFSVLGTARDLPDLVVGQVTFKSPEPGRVYALRKTASHPHSLDGVLALITEGDMQA